MDEDQWLQTLGAEPEDDAAWLVYADWLEERGDPRAEFLRLLVRLGNRGMAPADLRRTIKRMQRLHGSMNREWLAEVTRLRADRPTRLRILDALSGPGSQDMFDYARTILRVVLESGTLRIGNEIRIPLEGGGSISERVTGSTWSHNGNPLLQLSAGQEPLAFELFWPRYYPGIQQNGVILLAEPL